MSLNRAFISYLCVGLLSFLGGCNENISSDEQYPDTINTPTMTSAVEEGSTAFDLLSIQFSKASLISQEGMEVEVAPSIFQEQWDYFISSVEEASPPSFKHMYTVVAWDNLNQPYVIQASKKELKVGQNYYSGERINQFILWIKQHIGEQYLSSLSMERMTLQANDIGIKRQIPDESAKEIYQLIQTSTLVKSEARIESPLFPYYQLDVEYSGKEFLRVDVLSPTLISLVDGADLWYFQLHSSLFAYITDVIPVTDYSRNHIKHLFNAKELRIQEIDHILDLSEQLNDSLKEKAVIHQISRLLAEGKPSEKAKEELEEIQVTMEFIFADQSSIQIMLFDNYFLFDDELYQLIDVRNRINSFYEKE